ncbi:MAG: DUF2183 domain-containing protein [Proteobacteria bacterium]|nr:DUF2183 domain-containing protein [Pseudomonadota bacterium]
MKSIFPRRYDVWRLVNRKICHDSASVWQHPIQLISDIDKTYLETAYESLRGMARIMLERAADKKTVEGAREFLRAMKFQEGDLLHWNELSPPLHFISSSPPQLRPVLEHKMAMDYLTCATNSFKDQMYNLKTGKISLIKHQVSYKVASILSLVSRFKQTKSLILLGDNKESDPYIYTLIKYIVTGRLGKQESLQCLTCMDVSQEISESIFERLAINQLLVNKNPNQQELTVLICIRRDQKDKIDEQGELGRDIFWFDGYDELALMFYHLGYFSEEGLLQFFLESCMHSHMEESVLKNIWRSYQEWSTRTADESNSYMREHRQLIHQQGTQKIDQFFATMTSGQELSAAKENNWLLLRDPELSGTEFTEAFCLWVKSHMVRGTAKS